jgi:2-polyprenyl-6-methoxyphenol hydroxylase-like FAD-dependent oxidoreductase
MCVFCILSFDETEVKHYMHNTLNGERAPTVSSSFDTDVLICGAGAAGLTLAIDLARRNVAFLLIDKITEPFGGSRGKGIQPRTQEIFEDLGFVDRIVALGGHYPPQREYRSDGSYDESAVMEHNDPTPAEPYLIPLMVPQFLTEAVMRERLTELGHRPLFGHELKNFNQDTDGVTAEIACPGGEKVVRARYLVGADGGRSFVRTALNVEFPGETLGVRAVVADLSLEGLSSDAWHRWNDGSPTQMSLCPLRGTDLFQLQAPVPLEGEVDLSASGLLDMVATRTGRKDIIVHSVLWASAYNMNARLADRYRIGRIFLAGDAAHIHPPTGGQGLNTSVQDTYNLGWKLASVLSGAPDTLLDTYESERRPIAAGMLGLATKLLSAIKDRGELRRGREVHQLDLGYKDSALSIEKPSRTAGLKAGDRAPDAPCRGTAGQSTRLFNLFKGPHWTLLGYGIGRTAAVSLPRAGLHIHTIGYRGDLVDNNGHIHSGYGLSTGDWALIRPDGYVAAIVSSNEIVALEAYLETVGLGQGAPNAVRKTFGSGGHYGGISQSAAIAAGTDPAARAKPSGQQRICRCHQRRVSESRALRQ